MDDVWGLENGKERQASDDLSIIAGFAVDGDTDAQSYLKELWGENWPSIKEKLLTEGSVWYVWWMDGVKQHIVNHLEG